MKALIPLYENQTPFEFRVVAPALFYADWVQPIAEHHTTLKPYRTRLPTRPSFSHRIDDARPYRRFFPLGAPDRD